MKKTNLTLIAIVFAINFSYAQTNVFPSSGNVGIGTTNPTANLDLGKLLSFGDLSIVLARLSEGNTTGSGTYLGIRGFDTQLGNGITNINDVKSFSIEHGFYGAANSSINFLRGSSITGGSISFNTNNNVEQMRISYNGNVGIGTTTPGALFGEKLAVNGSITVMLGNTLYFSNSDNTNAAGIKASTTSGISAADLNLYGGAGIGTGVFIQNGGNVGIGTTDPKGYKLAVNGSVIATSMTVKLNANWPDYVFKPTYHLPSLAEVQTYINQNHHLPEIPSEQEIAKDGINLGEMNKLLTKKVEELTLYLIKKDKKDKEKEVQINLLQKEVLLQQQYLDQLTQQLTVLIKLNKK